MTILLSANLDNFYSQFQNRYLDTCFSKLWNTCEIPMGC